MTTSTRQRSKRMATQASEMALAVPHVVAHRVARMATSGANPSARDRREFQRMGAEKIAAFGESWNAMAWQMLRANQALTLSLMRAWWNPWLGGRQSFARSAQQVQSVALGVMSQGMEPVRRRAVANAKRLGKAKGR
jgi:hypothetical protein